MTTKLNGGESLMAADVRVQAMKEAYAGRGDGGLRLMVGGMKMYYEGTKEGQSP